MYSNYTMKYFLKKSFNLTIASFLLAGSSLHAQNATDLKNWPSTADPKDVGKRITEKFLKTPHTQFGNPHVKAKRYITYPDVCTWLGGIWFAKLTHDDHLLDQLEKRLVPALDKQPQLRPKPNHVDNSVFGVLPLEFYLNTKKQNYLDLGIHYADAQWNLPKNANKKQREWAKQGYTWQTRIWIDDMFMITAIQAQAYRATQDPKYIDRAAKEMVLYLDKIQLENGLFYHAPKAPYTWGRGNGWMAAGMAELLRILPENHPQQKRIMAAYQKMMATLLAHQNDNGMWRQLVDDKESWEETSGTAMFTYAFITGVKKGWLDKKTYAPAARKGWLALTKHINEQDELTEICVGTNIKNSREHYMKRPRVAGDLHGQAPLLWCAAALLR